MLKSFSAKTQEAITGYLFISPQLVGFVLIVVFPILAVFVFSLTEWPMIKTPSFVGFENYVDIAKNDSDFWAAVNNSIYFSLGVVILNISLALFLAVLLDQKIKGVQYFRTIVFLPVVTSEVVWAIVWKYILAPEVGPLNATLETIGFSGINWLWNTATVLPTVVILQVLKYVGMNMLIFLGALQEISKEYYESAKIDGAGPMRMFFNITIPLITPTIFMTMLITMIGSLKVFTLIYNLTGGGPGTSTLVLVYYIWKRAFEFFNFGYASAIAVILFMIILIITIIQWVTRKKWVFLE